MHVVQGKVQGPCSLEELISWVDLLKNKSGYQEQYEAFKKVSVWRVSHIQLCVQVLQTHGRLLCHSC